MTDRFEEDATEAEPQSLDETQDLGDRARGPVALVIVILLLLLTMCVTVGSLTRFQLSRAQFLARNAECLVCHTEVLAQMRLDSQHQPFISKHCTSCHTPHGRRSPCASSPGTPRSPRVYAVAAVGAVPLAVARREPAPTPRPRARRPPGRSRAARQRASWPFRADCAAHHTVLELSSGRGSGSQEHRRAHALPEQPLHVVSQPARLRHGAAAVGPDEQMCGQCHPMRDLAMPVTHQPAANWLCRSCHKAHGSNYPGMLFDTQRVVCFSCHPSVAQDSLMRVLHQPFIGDECTGCHEPHGPRSISSSSRPNPSFAISATPAQRASSC